MRIRPAKTRIMSGTCWRGRSSSASSAPASTMSSARLQTVWDGRIIKKIPSISSTSGTAAFAVWASTAAWQAASSPSSSTLWYNKLNVLTYLDFIAPNVLLAQAIGRMGNFVNQELYGPPTTVPWAFHINPTFPCQLPNNIPQIGGFICGSGNVIGRSRRMVCQQMVFIPLSSMKRSGV